MYRAAVVCSISQEHDPSAGNIYRWVIPVEDPCSCTEIHMGGMNTRTSGRNFKVIYFDSPTSTADEVHEFLNCSCKFTLGVHAIPAVHLSFVGIKITKWANINRWSLPEVYTFWNYRDPTVF